MIFVVCMAEGELAPGQPREPQRSLTKGTVLMYHPHGKAGCQVRWQWRTLAEIGNHLG